MVKKKLQDIMPNRSIRDIPVAGKRASSLHHEKTAHVRERDQLIEKLERREQRRHTIMDSDVDLNDFDDQYSDAAHKNFTKWGFWIITVVGIVFFIFSIILFFAGATVTVEVKQSTVAVNKQLSAKPDSTTSANTLTYQVLTLSKEATSNIAISSTSVSSIDQVASGKITISNTFSTTPVILIKNTRFASDSGLIYRVREAIRVPGYTVKNGVTVAGTLDVTVYADQPGSNYNVSNTHFTVPGFKSDTARYTKIVAQSKTDITGGIAKNEPGISASDKDIATEQLKTGLKDALLKDIQSQKPADSVLFDGAYTIDYSSTVSKDAKTNGAIVKEQAVMQAIVFNKKTFSRSLVSNEIDAAGGDVDIKGLDTLVFVPLSQGSGLPKLTQQNPLIFKMTGSVTITGKVDTAKLQNALMGKPKADLQTIINAYPTIAKAEAMIRPFWKTVFPTDISKIKVKIEQN
jgi:hypothetical protein